MQKLRCLDKVITRSFLVCCLAGLFPAGAAAQPTDTQFHAVLLEGVNVVLPVLTEANGEARFILQVDGSLNFEVEVELIDGVTAIHLHLGARFANGPVIAVLFSDPMGISIGEEQIIASGTLHDSDLTPQPGFDGTIATLIQRMTESDVYVDVHTTGRPDGEIRDQVVPEIEVPGPIASLRGAFIPEPTNLDDFVRDREAAILLGKALFWDMQAGSDKVQACATCHFHAGADNRRTNQLSPGLLGGDRTFQLGGPNFTLRPSDFPFHRLADPDENDSKVLLDTNDVTSSQGVLNSRFVNVLTGDPQDLRVSEPDPDGFQIAGINTRKVEPRNTPTVINAVFNLENFWDGRARFFFNGVNPHGTRDKSARVLQVSESGEVEKVRILIDFASLASQAVGPPLSNFEMSARGRTFARLGRKLLTLRPLGLQLVHLEDSVLGNVSMFPEKGIGPNYPELIRRAFHRRWWDSDRIFDQNCDEVPIPTCCPEDAEFTMMEVNFSLFWGLAIQLYEATQVSDQTPFDDFAEGNTKALTAEQQEGLELFQKQGRCAQCHPAPLFHEASFVRAILPEGPIEAMNMATLRNAIYDGGFYNIGVRPTREDIARGALDPMGHPLSFSGFVVELGQDHPNLGVPPFEPLRIRDDQQIAVRGSFKTPTLRNVELTGPFFHNGGQASLEQVVQFYTRGADFAELNEDQLDPDIAPIGKIRGHPERVAAVAAFLRSLTDERVRNQEAPFDHPQLFVPDGHDLVEDPPGSGNYRTRFIEVPAVGAKGRLPEGLEPIKPFLEDDAPPHVRNPCRCEPQYRLLCSPRNFHGGDETVFTLQMRVTEEDTKLHALSVAVTLLDDHATLGAATPHSDLFRDRGTPPLPGSPLTDIIPENRVYRLPSGKQVLALSVFLQLAGDLQLHRDEWITVADIPVAADLDHPQGCTLTLCFEDVFDFKGFEGERDRRNEVVIDCVDDPTRPVPARIVNIDPESTDHCLTYRVEAPLFHIDFKELTKSCQQCPDPAAGTPCVDLVACVRDWKGFLSNTDAKGHLTLQRAEGKSCSPDFCGDCRKCLNPCVLSTDLTLQEISDAAHADPCRIQAESTVDGVQRALAKARAEFCLISPEPCLTPVHPSAIRDFCGAQTFSPRFVLVEVPERDEHGETVRVREDLYFYTRDCDTSNLNYDNCGQTWLCYQIGYLERANDDVKPFRELTTDRRTIQLRRLQVQELLVNARTTPDVNWINHYMDIHSLSPVPGLYGTDVGFEVVGSGFGPNTKIAISVRGVPLVEPCCCDDDNTPGNRAGIPHELNWTYIFDGGTQCLCSPKGSLQLVRRSDTRLVDCNRLRVFIPEGRRNLPLLPARPPCIGVFEAKVYVVDEQQAPCSDGRREYQCPIQLVAPRPTPASACGGLDSPALFCASAPLTLHYGFTRLDFDYARSGVDSFQLYDAFAILFFLFGEYERPMNEPVCQDAADANDNGRLEIADPLLALQVLFSVGPQPARPFWPELGFDPSADALHCAFTDDNARNVVPATDCFGCQPQ
jgi:cytochrome c peroxidase